MLLINPPVTKPCEPPAGIALIAGALESHNIRYTLLDANLEALHWLLNKPLQSNDTWTRRAFNNKNRNLLAIQDTETFTSFDRYVRAVKDLSRLISNRPEHRDTIISLADYQSNALSPVKSGDLIKSAEQFMISPYHAYFTQRLPKLLDNVTIVGISLNYLSQAIPAFAMIGFIRHHYAHLTVVLGGGLITSWMARPNWESKFDGLVDLMIAGPGEEALLSLFGVELLVDTTFTPCYESLPSHDYLSPGMILPYSASSGCYWSRCSFCPENSEGSIYHPIPAGRAIKELSCLTDQYKPSLIHLLDNAISPALLRELAINPVGYPWYGFARIDEDLANPDFCAELRRSGCVMLKLGIESGDQGVLDRLHKGIELEIVSRVLLNLKSAGIAAYCYLLFGTPVEREENALKTMDFVLRHHEVITFINPAIFNMPVYGADSGKYKLEPFYDADLSLYTGFRHPDDWERGKVRKFLEREFKRHPAIATILKRTPPVFTSNHAPFFCKGAQ